MLYVFIGSCQLIIYGLAWLISRLLFKDKYFLIPYVMLIVGVVGGVFSMYVLGWLF